MSLLDKAKGGGGAEGDPTPTPSPAEGGRPEYIPEKFWDAEAKAPNVENLGKSYLELESKIGEVSDDKVKELREQFEADRIAARPETADDYALPSDERFDADALAASPVVALWRAAAHEAGIDQAGFEKVIIDYAEGEMQRLAGEAQAELGKLGDTAQDRLDAAEQFARSSFPEDEYAALAQVATTAAGVKMIERVMKLARESGVESLAGGDPAQSGDTLKDIRGLMQTPEYYDPARRDEAVMKRVADFFGKAQ